MAERRSHNARQGDGILEGQLDWIALGRWFIFNLISIVFILTLVFGFRLFDIVLGQECAPGRFLNRKERKKGDQHANSAHAKVATTPSTRRNEYEHELAQRVSGLSPAVDE